MWKTLVVAQGSNQVVAKSSLNQLLINIGRSDMLLTDEDYSILLQDAMGLPNTGDNENVTTDLPAIQALGLF